MSSRNREFLLYYDIERDVSSQVFNMPGRDDVDTLLRTTKRFIGNAKTIPPEHLSIQLLKMFRLSDDAEGKPSKNHREFVRSGWRM